MSSRGQCYLFSNQLYPTPHWGGEKNNTYQELERFSLRCYNSHILVDKELLCVVVLLLSPWSCCTQTGGGGMRLYGGCVGEVLGVSVRSSSLSSSTDSSSEFSSSSSSSSSDSSAQRTRGKKKKNPHWQDMMVRDSPAYTQKTTCLMCKQGTRVFVPFCVISCLQRPSP